MARYFSNSFRFIFSLCVFISCLSGCDSKKEGPKRADHAAAHTLRYHPDIMRHETPDAPDPTVSTQPAATTPSDETASIRGPMGSPVMFVNGESVTVMEV